MTVLLSTSEMAAADRAAMAAGVPGPVLMEAAGWQVAQAIRRRWAPSAVTVLCGPGNNGGDGFVVARLLERRGWPVRLALLGDRERLRGDAALMAARWRGPVLPMDPHCLDGRPLVVDALFGAGLQRPLEGMARQMVEEINRRRLAVVAVDLPSGVDGDTGEIRGAAVEARLTVTFFRPKPGHLLMPGRLLCGELVVGDIGIPEAVLGPIGATAFVNRPDLWRSLLPRHGALGNKYDRGHLLVAGGARMTGAARLAALAGRRAGAGLVTIAAAAEALAVYRGDSAGTIVECVDAWDRMLADRRHNAVVAGPGLGVGETARRLVLSALAAGKACVLDADALTSFAADPKTLWRAGGCPVLTPHDGEFARVFAHPGDRLERARRAAGESGAVVLLKGPDTVVAAPDGRAAIAANGPPDLATAGSGDVLAGIIGGLLAQGMAPFEAASAAVWMHGQAAAAHGAGLIAEDLIAGLPAVLAELRE
ncbi:MAG TPA: NAD(P)H-hydrate dehydratase [Rhodospirillaceae bacterium]|nr:NAD(P)H-hydrate dehydratase [Rhodospirillaceae bacterium]